MQPWHPSILNERKEGPKTETFLITNGVVSVVAHDRDACIWWSMLMIERGLAPTVHKWRSL